MKNLAIGVALAACGVVIWFAGMASAQDTYNIPIPPTADVSCVPNYVITDVGCTDPLIGHETDPCQEDEVLWWTGAPESPHTRTCLNLEEVCAFGLGDVK